MKIVKNLTLAAAAAIAVTLLLQPPIARADGSASVHIAFQKCLDITTGRFVGTVNTDCGAGTVDYVDLGSDYSKSVWRLTGEYTVSNGECSFKAVVSGIVNTQTGLIVLNGVVTEDSYKGAQFHVRAQLILGADGSVCSHGTMTITPN